jgi:hypothetical protein
VWGLWRLTWFGAPRRHIFGGKAHDKWSGAGRKTGPALGIIGVRHAKGPREAAWQGRQGRRNSVSHIPRSQALATPIPQVARELGDHAPCSHGTWRARMPHSMSAWLRSGILGVDARSNRAPTPPSGVSEAQCRDARAGHGDEAGSESRPHAGSDARSPRALYFALGCRPSCGCESPGLPCPLHGVRSLATECAICWANAGGTALPT